MNLRVGVKSYLSYLRFDRIAKVISLRSRCFSSSSRNFKMEGASVDAIEKSIDVDVSDNNEENDLIEKKRNKSGLKDKHHRTMNKKIPIYSHEEKEIMPLWMYRKLYGRFGSQANIDMKCLWPSDTEMEMMKEREALEYPHTVQEMITMAKEEKVREEQEIVDRQNELLENVKKLEKWKQEVRSRIAKKEEMTRIAMEKKQKQIDEVRATMGYTISPHDPKFQEVLDAKLEEERKRLKKEKKLQKQQEMLDRLMEEAKRDAKLAEK